TAHYSYVSLHDALPICELYYLGIGDDTSITKLAHYARMPDTVVMQHAIGNIAMRVIYRYIVYIGHPRFDANYFIRRIFFEEPFRSEGTRLNSSHSQISY